MAERKNRLIVTAIIVILLLALAIGLLSLRRPATSRAEKPVETTLATVPGEILADSPQPPTPTRQEHVETSTATTTAAPALAPATLTPTQAPPTPAPTQPPAPSATQTRPAPSATPSIPCNLAARGTPLDVTIPENSQLAPGQAFVKTWRLQNAGSCTWTPDYSLVWVSGESFGAAQAIPIGITVRPGDVVDFSVEMVAPANPGAYQGNWTLSTPASQLFGADPGSPATLAVKIAVVMVNTPTATTSPGRVSGRVTLNGAAPGSPVALRLEDQGYNLVAAATSAADGAYTFDSLPPSSQGYNLIFTQEANSGFAIEQVVSWAWLGPVPVSNGAAIQLPDFEIATQGFEQVSPEPEATVSAASLSPAAPLQFQWNAYPGATRYWVDLTQGEQQTPVWQSPLVQGNSASFDGALTDGTHIQPGEYWWGVGAQQDLGIYNLTLYGYLARLDVEP